MPHPKRLPPPVSLLCLLASVACNPSSATGSPPRTHEPPPRLAQGAECEGGNTRSGCRPQMATRRLDRVRPAPPTVDLSEFAAFEDGGGNCLEESPSPIAPPTVWRRGGSVKSGATSGSVNKYRAIPPRERAPNPQPSAGVGRASAPAAPAEGMKQEQASGNPGARQSGAEMRDSAADAEGSSYTKPASTSPKSPPARSRRVAQSVYLSNDDTMSLSSAQRVIWALENGAPIPQQHIRPHEFLNYFSFDAAPVSGDNEFSVLANLDRRGNEARLALSVAGRALSLSERRNVNLSYVLDRSGSMQQEGRMDYLKQGLQASLDQLKTGDVVHITLFDSDTCQLARNFVVGRDSMSRLRTLISGVTPRGSTNLHEGLVEGYRAADRTYHPEMSNRVVLITDAETNTGVTDPRLMAEVGRHYDERQIRLSGIGVGRTFNDALLDELTERGRGAYVYLGSEAEVNAVFGERFASLIETVAVDVHFRLDLPASLRLRTFYGEEASEDKDRVQAIHYFAGTRQLFLSDLERTGAPWQPGEQLALTIEYEDPNSGRKLSRRFPFALSAIEGPSANIERASFVTAFTQTLSDAGGDAQRLGASCRARHEQARLALGGRPQDPEMRKVDHLFDQFCERVPFVAASPRERPLRQNDFAPRAGLTRSYPQSTGLAPRQTWPSAQ